MYHVVINGFPHHKSTIQQVSVLDIRETDQIFTHLAKEPTTPNHPITTEAIQNAFFLYIGFGGPFWLKYMSASASETPVIKALRVAIMTYFKNISTELVEKIWLLHKTNRHSNEIS